MVGFKSRSLERLSFLNYEKESAENRFISDTNSKSWDYLKDLDLKIASIKIVRKNYWKLNEL